METIAYIGRLERLPCHLIVSGTLRRVGTAVPGDVTIEGLEPLQVMIDEKEADVA